MDLSPEANSVSDSALSMDDAAGKFAALYQDEHKEEEEAEEGVELEAEESGDTEEDEIEIEEEESDPEPAIAAPARLSADQKAKFASLPPEGQALFAEIELQRTQEVTKVTTRAAEAQREANARAAQADAQAKAVYAQQLNAIAAQIAPQAPDPALAQYDPASYIAQEAQFRAASAQHDQFLAHVKALGTAANEEIDQTFIAERDAELMRIPEVANEETRATFFDKAFEAAKVLGFEHDAIMNADAAELKAMRQVADWKADSEKYRAALAKNMQKVREGKKAVKPVASHQGARDASLKSTQQRFAKSGDIRDAAALITARLQGQ